MRIRTLPEAMDELAEAIRYYDDRRPGLGRDLRDEFLAGIERIRSFPEGWRRIEGNVRRCSLRRFPYGIIYLLRADEAIVLALSHASRRPDYWAGRVPESDE